MNHPQWRTIWTRKGVSQRRDVQEYANIRLDAVPSKLVTQVLKSFCKDMDEAQAKLATLTYLACDGGN